MLEKLSQFQEEIKKIEKDFQNPKIFSSAKKMKELSKRYNELKKIIQELEKLKKIDKQLKNTQKLIEEEKNEELRKIAKEDIEKLKKEKNDLEEKIKELLRPKDEFEAKDIIMEIRAGVGGDEAELFAADLLRMYSKYAEKKGWQLNLLDINRSELGGVKEAILEIKGKNVYENLKYESGVHRVQRIPETEKSGRIHTSTATVAVLPKAEKIDIKINPEDIRIDTFLSSGPGGQGVQTTYSGVRITHLPTNIVVTCQSTRSQIQNKEKALEILRSRLFALEKEKRDKEISQKRKEQIGRGERTEKIRTYNFPQDRVTDHRIKKSWHNISNILDGELEEIITSLKEEKNKMIKE